MHHVYMYTEILILSIIVVGYLAHLSQCKDSTSSLPEDDIDGGVLQNKAVSMPVSKM